MESTKAQGDKAMRVNIRFSTCDAAVAFVARHADQFRGVAIQIAYGQDGFWYIERVD
jgi:hypothetical protein